MRTRVYIAGPISKGDVEQNVRKACKVAGELIALGYAPLCPQLTCYMQSPVASFSAGFDHHIWLEVDLPWVEASHAVLRIPGESKGADREVEHAKKCGIEIFHSIEELQGWVAPVGKLQTERKKGDPRFHSLLKQIGDLHDKKQQDYGSSADPFANIRGGEEFGVPA